jgi:hypothetical protein
MTALLKSLFDRNPGPSAEDMAAVNGASFALQDRMQQILRADASRNAASLRPTTDRFGRPLQS